MIHVFPVRLRPEAAREADFQKLNPHARPDGECYFICLTQARRRAVVKAGALTRGSHFLTRLGSRDDLAV
jgi:hypothetical protein